MKLQEFLSRYYGVSRRKAGDLVKSGHVKVNGEVVVEPWREVSTEDVIEVKGKPVVYKPQTSILIALYKPRKILSTMVFEERGKKGLLYLMKKNGLWSFLRDVKNIPRVFPVGRLDYDSEGLILLTNDGLLANELAHPSKKVPKEYLLDVLFCCEDSSCGDTCRGAGRSGGLPSLCGKVRKEPGVYKEKWERFLSREEALEDGAFSPDSLKVLSFKRFDYEGQVFAVIFKVRVKIHSGKKRILRRFFKAKGGKVFRLIRLSVGDYDVGDLKPGQWRLLEV